MATYSIYDRTRDAWGGHVEKDINSVESANYLALVDDAGELVAVNEALEKFAGGLISPAVDTEILPAHRYFGLDVRFEMSAEDLADMARGEFDEKITWTSGSSTPLPNQANISTQINASEGYMVQLDPTGSAWVDSGFTAKPLADAPNLYQVRSWTDGTKWSVTGLRFNGGTPFTPGAQFQGLPMITTNWGKGRHPQLQTEAFSAPSFLRVKYLSVRLLAADVELPWDLGF